MILDRSRTKAVDALEEAVVSALAAQDDGDGGVVAKVRESLPKDHLGQAKVTKEASRYNILFWGRQAGKTTKCRTLACEVAIDGGSVGYFTPKTKYLTEVFRELERTLKPLITKCDRNEMRIELSTGGSIDAWSLKDNPDAGRGRTYDRVIYEESGLILNLKEHWTEAARATLFAKQGDAWFNGTPKPRGYFNELFQKGQGEDPEYRSWKMPTTINPFIPKSEIEKARREYEADGLLAVFRQEYEAEPMRDLGAPFAAWLHCVGEMSKEDPVAMGWDIGEMQDQTIGYGLDHAGNVCKMVNAKSDHGAQDQEEIEDVIFSETYFAEASVDATGMGRGIFEGLEKRSIREGRVRPYEGRSEVAPAGGVAPRVVNGDRSIYEGVLFTENRKQEIYGGIRRFLMKKLGTVPEGPLTEALESAEYVIVERDVGPGVKIYVPRGIHKDHVDAYGLAIRAYLRTDQPRDVDGALDYYDMDDDEVSDAVAEEMAELAEVRKLAKRSGKKTDEKEEDDDDGWW